MKTKSTKRALLLSALSLLMCVSMLIGSTFAWFTDSVTSSNNKIVAGKLDVQLWMDMGEGYKDISASTDSIFNMINNKAQNINADTLWEPGKTQVAYLKIVNAGTLALKYSVALKITDVEKNLHEVMQYAITPDATYGEVTKWDADEGKNVVLGTQTVTETDVVMKPGDEHKFALSIHMLEEAGNQYQEGKLNFDLTVLAGQATVEEDAFGKDYDELAAYPYSGVGKLEGPNVAALEIPIYDNSSDKIGSMIVPAGAIDDATQKVKADMRPITYNGNFTIASGSTAQSYDISASNLVEGNTTPIKVYITIPEMLDKDYVKLYHYDQEIDYTYDPNTGYVIFETTSFSPFTVVYDVNKPYVAPAPLPEDLPKAEVTVFDVNEAPKTGEWATYGDWGPTEGLEANLETAYKYVAPADAAESPYADWYCDFYVKLDKDLKENQIFLGGMYGSFGWVGFHNGDLTLDANTEIPVLGSVGFQWTYEMIANDVKEFVCGVGDVNDALSGATFTVTLRLVNPEDSDDFIDVDVKNYTFQ